MITGGLRAGIAAGGVRGTFVKVGSPDVVGVAAAAGLDFVVVDAEHSQLSYSDVSGLVRYAAALGVPAVVRVPGVEAGFVNRVLEAGAAGIQLSTVRRRSDVDALIAAVRYAPHGSRSVSLSHPAAGYGADGLAAYLAAQAESPPLLVGQFETATYADPLPSLMPGLDVAFVGTTDLTVSLGAAPLAPAVAAIEEAARGAGVAFGGWVPSRSAVGPSGLGAARYLVIGSDLHLLGTAFREIASE